MASTNTSASTSVSVSQLKSKELDDQFNELQDQLRELSKILLPPSCEQNISRMVTVVESLSKDHRQYADSFLQLRAEVDQQNKIIDILATKIAMAEEEQKKKVDQIKNEAKHRSAVATTTSSVVAIANDDLFGLELDFVECAVSVLNDSNQSNHASNAKTGRRYRSSTDLTRADDASQDSFLYQT